MKVGIFIKSGSHEKCIDTFIDALNRRSIENFIVDDYTERPDVLAVFGGDGTILAAASYALQFNAPIVSVNIGTVGFLSSFEADEVNKIAELIAENKLDFSSRSLLEVKSGNRKYYALNDIVVERDKSFVGGSVVCKISLKIGGITVYDLSSDGVIISTPTGSTAYSLSSGGVILTPDLKSFIATPICSHSLSTRPIVYPDGKTAEININKNSSDCVLSVDGKPIKKLSQGDTVMIKKSAKHLRIADGGYNFFEKIKTKLG